MKTFASLEAPPTRVSLIERHTYICDLVYSEGPLLSLFRDAKRSWLYLWSDTDQVAKERWLVFSVSRSQLVDYLQHGAPLNSLLLNSSTIFVLDQSVALTSSDGANQSRRQLRQIRSLESIAEYVPADDSFFDESLAPDISLAYEVIPKRFSVPLDGDWFFSDLDKFSRVYSQLYSFFYCAKPRFITSIGERVGSLLRAPWAGGFSRVNLFEALSMLVPSLHDLQIKRIEYASPGKVEIEALASVGESISLAVGAYLENGEAVKHSVKAINQVFSAAKLKKRDLSGSSDETLPLRRENIEYLKTQTQCLAHSLHIAEEFDAMCANSPNHVVSAKVLLALVKRVERLAIMQRTGLVPYGAKRDFNANGDAEDV